MADELKIPKFDLSDLLAFKQACIEAAEAWNTAWEVVAKEVVACFNKQALAVVEIAQVFVDIREKEAQRQAELTKPRARRMRVELADG
jgi:CRISPR/Cas system-associated endonuclease Cas3-HD